MPLTKLCLQLIDLGTEERKIYVPIKTATGYTEKSSNFFWSKVWPASIALSRFLLSHSHLIYNKKILELGAGLGLPSITAAAFAQYVYCSDAASEAMEIVAASVAYNKIKNIQCVVLSWKKISNFPKADVLLLSDVSYDPENFYQLHTLINHFLNMGTPVIISTPQRLTARNFMEKIMQWCVLQKEYIIKDDGTDVYTTVFLLAKNSEQQNQ